MPSRCEIEMPKTGDVMTVGAALRLAIQEAKKGAGFVSPNPLVGCTILDSRFRFLSVGYHQRVGGAHAEINAIKNLSSESNLKGAHLFVTLEPCAHSGRTPSCAKTLAENVNRPATVTYAVSDPNPIAGGGAVILMAAGIKTAKFSDCDSVDLGERLEVTALAEDLAEIFLHNVRTSEPFVSVKVAASIDGCMALSSGESKWITGASAREHTHFLRAHYDAILIGRNTFVADDPQLNVRHELFPNFANKVVLLDPMARTLDALKTSQLLRVRDSNGLIVVVKRGLLPAVLARLPDGVQLIELESQPVGQGCGQRVGQREDTFDAAAILKSLGSIGIRSLMIEGGAQTFGAFFSANRVQRLHLFEAPVLIGGQHGLSWSAQFGVDRMAKRWKLSNLERRVLGDDLYTTGRVVSYNTASEV